MVGGPSAGVAVVRDGKVLFENGYGLAAFNVNNMEQIQSIMEAAEETDSPVIVQASRANG